MYMLELYQNPSYKDLVAFGSLKEGKEFVSKITGYTLENEDDFIQGNKIEITNIYMKGLELTSVSYLKNLKPFVSI